MALATLLGLAHAGPKAVRLHTLTRSQRHAASSMRGWGAWPFTSSSSPPGSLGEESLVQRIYSLASVGDLDGAQAAMDDLLPESVGLDSAAVQQPRSSSSSPPHVSYMHLFSDPTFSMGVFILPTGAKIPLHDHPEMTVLSKLLFGMLQVTSYDTGELIEGGAGSTRRSLSNRRQPVRMRCSQPREHTVSAPAPTLRLDPVRGNVHEFVALSDVAILDVLMPPYSDREGRSCRYYKTSSGDTGAVEKAGTVDLVEVGWPEELVVDSVAYRGPRIGPKA
jgi:cysteamine dioxygenase